MIELYYHDVSLYRLYRLTWDDHHTQSVETLRVADLWCETTF